MPRANGASTNPLGLTKKCPLCGNRCGSNRATFCSARCYLTGWVQPQASGCILWTGPVGNHGYGNFSLDKTLHLTHRAAYMTFVGHIPDGLYVCHRCDVKTCVNPEHLFLGTPEDNTVDCVLKRRNARKLTDDEVRQIRSVNGVPYAQLSRLYGVTDVMIRNIILKKWWRHLPEKNNAA